MFQCKVDVHWFNKPFFDQSGSAVYFSPGNGLNMQMSTNDNSPSTLYDQFRWQRTCICSCRDFRTFWKLCVCILRNTSVHPYCQPIFFTNTVKYRRVGRSETVIIKNTIINDTDPCVSIIEIIIITITIKIIHTHTHSQTHTGKHRHLLWEHTGSRQGHQNAASQIQTRFNLAKTRQLETRQQGPIIQNEITDCCCSLSKCLENKTQHPQA